MGRLEDLGARVVRSTATHDYRGGTPRRVLETWHYVVLDITLARPSGVRATFRHETLADKLAKVIVSEVQTGDPTFDDAIFVQTSTPAETSAFLADDAARSAVLSTMIGGDLRIDDDQVYVKQRFEDENDVVAIVRALGQCR